MQKDWSCRLGLFDDDDIYVRFLYIALYLLIFSRRS